MIYLTGEQVEALSPIKREVYNKRLKRDIERETEEFIRNWHVPLYAASVNCTMWVDRSRLEALTKALAIEQQFQEKLKTELASLYEES